MTRQSIAQAVEVKRLFERQRLALQRQFGLEAGLVRLASADKSAF